MDLQLKDQVAVITGAASGIGRATAELFAAEGAHCVLWDRDPKVADAARELAKAHGVRTLGQTVDVTDETAIAKAVRAAGELGSISRLVHAAAIGSGHFGFPFWKLKPDDWDTVLSVNIRGMVNVAHAFAPKLAASSGGSMVFLASVAGQIGSQTDPPYSASKAANINFAQCMARDLAPHGVRVNTICPGMVQTPLNRGVWQAWNEQQPPEEQKTYDEWAGEKVQKVVPLGEWQSPEDVARMIVFLSSPMASQVTGQTINVDGGYVMHW